MSTIFCWPTGGTAIRVTCSGGQIYGRFVFISRPTINSHLTGCKVMASASKINCIYSIVVSRWIANTCSPPLLFRDIQKQYTEITGVTPDVNVPTFLRFLWLTLGQSYVCSSASEIIPTDIGKIRQIDKNNWWLLDILMWINPDWDCRQLLNLALPNNLVVQPVWANMWVIRIRKFMPCEYHSFISIMAMEILHGLHGDVWFCTNTIPWAVIFAWHNIQILKYDKFKICVG